MIKELNYFTDNRKLSVFFVIIFVIVFVIAQLSPTLNSYSLYGIVPFLFIYSLLKSPKLIWNYKPLLFYLLLIIVSAVSCVNSVFLDDSLKELKTLSGGFALCYIVTFFSLKNRRYIYLFYILNIAFFFVVLYQGYVEGLTYSTAERFSSEKLNANFFGYVGFDAIVSSFFVLQFVRSFIINVKNKQNFYLFLFITTSILSLVANLYAATRGGTIICLLAILFFVYTKFLSSFSIRKFISLFILSFLGFLVSQYGSIIYRSSALQQRFNETDIYEDSRTRLLADAYYFGMQNPLLGLGPANFKHFSYNGGFSHSTYFEIFANNGIFALMLFIAMIVPFFRNIWKYKPNDINQIKNRLYFMTFIMLFVAYNFFYVFHTTPPLITFYYLVLIHSFYSLQNNKIKTHKENIIN